MNELKPFLQGREITIQEFADSIGYSRVYISYVINGRSNPSRRFLKAVELELNRLMHYQIPKFKKEPEKPHKIVKKNKK